MKKKMRTDMMLFFFPTLIVSAAIKNLYFCSAVKRKKIRKRKII